MVNEPFDEDEGWPDPQVLAAWRVPSLPYDFADRVLTHATITSGAVMQQSERRTRGSIAPLVAMVSAALAVAAMLVLVFAIRSERIVETLPAPEPAPAPEPVVATVPPTPTTTQLVLDVAPRDATVLVDGRKVAGLAPFVVGELMPGRHAIDVQREGFVPLAMTVEVGRDGLRLELSLVAAQVLAPLPPPTKTLPKTLPKRDLEDPFGGAKQRRDSDHSGSSASLKDPFQKAPAPAATRTATLRLGVVAGMRAATVSIDGRVVGMTPIANHKVTPGKHRIRWDWDDGRVFEQTIDIAAGDVMLLKGG